LTKALDTVVYARFSSSSPWTPQDLHGLPVGDDLRRPAGPGGDKDKGWPSRKKRPDLSVDLRPEIPDKHGEALLESGEVTLPEEWGKRHSTETVRPDLALAIR
jgi:hypothetical protein